jgi:hypothetical protein
MDVLRWSCPSSAVKQIPRLIGFFLWPRLFAVLPFIDLEGLYMVASLALIAGASYRETSSPFRGITIHRLGRAVHGRIISIDCWRIIP